GRRLPPAPASRNKLRGEKLAARIAEELGQVVQPSHVAESENRALVGDGPIVALPAEEVVGTSPRGRRARGARARGECLVNRQLLRQARHAQCLGRGEGLAQETNSRI